MSIESVGEDLFVGIDLGGTTTAVGLVSPRGEVLCSQIFATRVERGPTAIICEMAERARALWQERGLLSDQIGGVGVGSPGPLDPKTGVIITTPNLKWENVPLQDLLVDQLDKPVLVDNDAVAATFGEWWMGAGRPYRDVVGLTLGTGVGGGIILDGEVHHGFQGIGGHIGHMVVQAKGRRCSCGNQGCLEAYASASAIVKRAQEILAEGTGSLLHSIDGPLTSEQIFQAANQGDDLACQIFDETAYYLAVGVNNVLNILNPESVVVMGAVANAGDVLMVPLQKHLSGMAFPSVCEETQVLFGSLGEMAGVIGAAGLALHHRKLDPS